MLTIATNTNHHTRKMSAAVRTTLLLKILVILSQGRHNPSHNIRTTTLRGWGANALAGMEVPGSEVSRWMEAMQVNDFESQTGKVTTNPRTDGGGGTVLKPRWWDPSKRGIGNNSGGTTTTMERSNQVQRNSTQLKEST